MVGETNNKQGNQVGIAEMDIINSIIFVKLTHAPAPAGLRSH